MGSNPTLSAIIPKTTKDNAHMDNKTKGAWIIHHGRKLNDNANAAAQYGALDLASKSALLLSRMAASEEATLSNELVTTLGKAGGLNPKSDLKICLEELKKQKVIDVSTDGSVSVLGVTGASALNHATEIFERNEPESQELAVIDLSEQVSNSPLNLSTASEYISDSYKLKSTESKDLIAQATSIGFIDTDSDKDDPLLFNGNLFRRDTVAKTRRVLSSLSQSEQIKLAEFEALLKAQGAIHISKAEQLLGVDLLSKLRAAAVFDENNFYDNSGLLQTKPIW